MPLVGLPTHARKKAVGACADVNAVAKMESMTRACDSKCRHRSLIVLSSDSEHSRGAIDVCRIKGFIEKIAAVIQSDAVITVPACN